VKKNKKPKKELEPVKVGVRIMLVVTVIFTAITVLFAPRIISAAKSVHVNQSKPVVTTATK